MKRHYRVDTPYGPVGEVSENALRVALRILGLEVVGSVTAGAWVFDPQTGNVPPLGARRRAPRQVRT